MGGGSFLRGQHPHADVHDDVGVGADGDGHHVAAIPSPIEAQEVSNAPGPGDLLRRQRWRSQFGTGDCEPRQRRDRVQRRGRVLMLAPGAVVLGEVGRDHLVVAAPFPPPVLTADRGAAASWGTPVPRWWTR